MAFFSSIKRAQDIQFCELCQDGSVKWKCIDCDMWFCDRCYTCHSRFPAAAQHQIVPIGTPVQEAQKKIIIDNIPCKDHPKKMQKEKELIDVIRQYSNDLKEKVEIERSRINGRISKIQQDIDNQKKILQDQRLEIDAVLNSNQGKFIYNTNIIIKDLQFESIPYQVEQFIPETEFTEEIQKLFGSLRKLSIPTTNALPEIELEVIRSFTTDLFSIDRVVSLDKTSAWISCYNKQVIRKVNIQNKNMTTSQEVSLEVFDMAVTSNNELFLTLSGESDVKLMKRSGKIIHFLTVAPLLPLGIHVTKNNYIILGVREPGNLYTPTEQSQRAVIVLDENGKEKKRYKHDDEGNRLFTVPFKIRTNYNHDIVVVDRISKNTGKVVVLKRGKLRWVYGGHNEINASKRFSPRDIVTTTIGHIVVCDYGSHAIHVLSGDGEVLTCKVMKDMAITNPIGLGIDYEGRLWVGCGTGGKESEAKLHIINLTS